MKVPFSFATRLLFRLFLPGFLLTLGCWPLLEKTLKLLELSVDRGLLLLLATIVLGWLIVILDAHIYMFFEGRRYWPGWLRHRLFKMEQARLAKLRLTRQKLNPTKDESRIKELDIEEFKFPLAENGTPEAVYPTRLGNIMTEYETYPDRKYGIDGVFYWYRVWLCLSSDLRNEIDDHQSVVDGTVYVSFVLYFAGLMFLSYSVLNLALGIRLIDSVGSAGAFWIGGASILCGYVVYRLSLQAHWQFGNLFKAMFDCFYNQYDPKSVLNLISEATQEPYVKDETGPNAYRIVWRYLRWHEFRPRGADKNVNFEQARKGPDENVSSKRTTKNAPRGRGPAGARQRTRRHRPD